MTFNCVQGRGKVILQCLKVLMVVTVFILYAQYINVLYYRDEKFL